MSCSLRTFVLLWHDPFESGLYHKTNKQLRIRACCTDRDAELATSRDSHKWLVHQLQRLHNFSESTFLKLQRTVLTIRRVLV